jgi:hypothetical protein
VERQERRIVMQHDPQQTPGKTITPSREYSRINQNIPDQYPELEPTSAQLRPTLWPWSARPLAIFAVTRSALCAVSFLTYVNCYVHETCSRQQMSI